MRIIKESFKVENVKEIPSLESISDIAEDDFNDKDYNEYMEVMVESNAIMTCLESYNEILSNSLLTKDLTQQAALMLNTGLQHITHNSNIPFKNVYYSTEAFNEENISITTEGIYDTVREGVTKIWDGIVAFIKKIIEAINVFYVKYFDEATKTLANVNKLATALKTNKITDTSKNIDIPVAIFNNLYSSIKGTIAGFNNITKDIKIAVDYNTYNDELNKLIDEFTEIFKTFASDHSKLGAWINKYNVLLEKTFSDLNMTKSENNYTKNMIGNKIVTITYTPFVADKPGSIVIHVANIKTNNEGTTSFKLNDSIELDNLLNAVSETLKMVISHKNQAIMKLAKVTALQIKYSKAKNALDSFYKENAQKTDTPVNEGVYSHLSRVISNFRLLYILINEPGLTYQKQALSSAISAYNLAVLCAKGSKAANTEAIVEEVIPAVDVTNEVIPTEPTVVENTDAIDVPVDEVKVVEESNTPIFTETTVLPVEELN